MLVLSRKPEEGIVIVVPPSSQPTSINVKTLGVRGVTVKLGFEAPKETVIFRSELREQGRAA